MHTAFDKIILFGGSFVLIVYSVYCWLYKQKQEKSYFIIYPLCAIVLDIETPYWYLSIAYVLLMIFHYLMEKDLIIRISGEQIKVKDLLTHTYAWNEFNNIVLMDALLTLDFKNNKVMQVEPGGENFPDQKGLLSNYDAFEKGFNEFCKLHLRP